MKASKFFCFLSVFVLLAFGCRKKPAETKKWEKPSEQTILLCKAAEEGDIEKVQSLIASNADVNAKNEYGYTPLHCAVDYGQKIIAEFLIESGAEVDAKNKVGETPLHIAADLGRKDFAELLINNGANIEAKDDFDKTSLHVSVIKGHKNFVEFLIKNGANIEAMDEDGETPLYKAIRGPRNGVWYSFGSRADIKAERNKEDRDTTRDLPSRERYNVVALFLIDNGANVNTKDSWDDTLLHEAAKHCDKHLVEILIAKGADVNAKDNWGNTPLHEAVSGGNKDVVELLIDNGADINAENKSSETPLHSAVDSPLHSAPDNRKNIAKLLINKGASIDTDPDLLHIAASRGYWDLAELLILKGVDVNAKDDENQTPLHVAYGRSVTELLINNGADIEAKDTRGRTPLHSAVLSPWEIHNNKDMIDLLITNKADINAITNSGWTPLHYAAREGYTEVAQLLIANGAQVNAKTLSAWTPLHYAARWGRINVAELLIANSADIHAKDNNGQTPLHKAAGRGFYNLVDLLVEEGADVNDVDNDGKSAMDCARAKGHNDVVELLKGNRLKVNATEWYDERTTDFVDGRAQKATAKSLTDTDSLVLSNSTFAFDLYRQLCSREGNLFFSPYSISTALALAYAGARGNTEKQMAQTLHFSLDQKTIHPVFAELQAVLNRIQKDGDIKLCVANSLWPQQDYKFLDEYLSLVKRSYGAYITGVDYINARQTACKLINEWVENETEDRIKDMVQPESLDELTLLVLVNAIYFKGNWESPFDVSKTKDVTFYVSSKKSVQIPMMHQTEEFRYAEFRTLQIIELPYIGDSLSMLLILPKRIGGLEQIENNLSVENIEFWRQSVDEKKVRVSIPKFKMSHELSLVKTLQALGIEDAFIYQQANFAGMDGRDNWLFLGGVIHKSFIEVNEEGTEAAAATVVGMLGGAPPTPPVFRADHPFLFLILEKQTGSILFIGRVTDPTRSGQ